MLNEASNSTGTVHTPLDDGSLILMGSVLRAIKAEEVLLAQGYEVRLVVPPIELRTGCDLALACSTHVVVGIAHALESADLAPKQVLSTLMGTSTITEVVTRAYFDIAGNYCSSDDAHFLMVRAGNMKLTIDVKSGVITNTSGGGCPDVPYLNMMMIGHHINEISRPKELGKTLCGLMLDKAYLMTHEEWNSGGATSGHQADEVRV